MNVDRITKITRRVGLFVPAPKHIVQAGHVLTGIEVEFYTDSKVSFSNYQGDCWDYYRPSWDRSDVNVNNYYNQFKNPKGWLGGTDGPWAEIRSAEPTPLDKQPKNLENLREYFKDLPRVKMTEQMSFHVHINTNKNKGPWVHMPALVQTFYWLRPQLESLVVSPDRFTSGWCDIPDEGELASEDWDPPYDDKECALNHSYHDTLEFRLWDASKNKTLHNKRMEMLKVWVATALQRQEQMGV